MPSRTPTPAALARGAARLTGLGAGVLVAGLAGSRAWALLASRGRIHSPATAPTVDVAVVLGAGLRPDGRPCDYLAARLDLAVELWRRGKAKVLVVSGASVDGADEPAAMHRYLVEHGVPDEVVVEDREGIDTYATCRRARRVYGLGRVALVSQGYHLPRTLALASATGLDAVGVADWSMQHEPAAAPSVWARGELREWVAGLKVLGDLVRPRTEDDPEHDPAVQHALAAQGPATTG